MMNKIEALFTEIIGHPVWSVSGRKGSSFPLQLEFGKPHLVVMQPHAAKSEVSENVRRNLARRKVYPRGEWHFETIFAEWFVTIERKRYRSSDGSLDTGVVDLLSGQVLLSVRFDPNLQRLFLEFDGEASVEIERPSQIVSNDAGLWYLRCQKTDRQGDNFFLSYSGDLTSVPDNEKSQEH